MKKMILCFAVSAALYACGGNSDSKSDSANSEEKDVTDDPAFIAGRDLVSKSDCFTCHKIDDVSVGPAYRKVAEKYPNTPENVAMLSSKVIKGGSGNWGTVPMTAHPALSPEDVATMVKYVLMLKK
jgi:cytochrome c